MALLISFSKFSNKILKLARVRWRGIECQLRRSKTGMSLDQNWIEGQDGGGGVQNFDFFCRNK